MGKLGIDRQAVLQAAAELADVKGVRGVTLKEVAARLQTKPPALYNHVKGQDDLNNLLAIHGLDLLKTQILHAAIGVSGNDAVMAMGKAYVGFAQDHPGLYESLQWVNIWEHEEAVQITNDIVDMLKKVLSFYDLRDEDTAHIIRMFRSLLHGFASISAHQGFGHTTSIEASLEKSINVMLAGMKCEFPDAL